MTNSMNECQTLFIDTIFQTGTGHCSNRIYPGERVSEVGVHRTTANSSMPCSGFCAPVRLGETFLPRMEDGKTPIDAFAAGATRTSGKRRWGNSLSSLMSNG